MSTDSTVRRFASPRFWSAVLFGTLVFLMLPAGVVVMNDDFGYLGSIIETFHRGRPWTDDWLEPWSVAPTILSALLFKYGGSFQIAVQGVQVLGAAAAGVGAFRLFQTRGMSVGASLIAALIGLSSPTLLWKFTEYTGMVVYVPCLLWALWAASERRWGLFLVIWLVAASTRQSAVAWLALPAWELLASRSPDSPNRASWKGPALVLTAAMAALVTFSLLLNRTQAQRMITDHLWERAQFASILGNALLGLGIWATFSGIGALLLSLCQQGMATPPSSRRILVLLGVGVVAFTFLDRLPTLFFEHGSYQGWPGLLYANLLIAGGIAGWTMVRFSLRPETLLAAMGALALVLLRPGVWDYYYADVAVLAFAGVRLGAVPSTPAAGNRWSQPLLMVMAVGFAGFHLWFAWQLKCRVDRDWASCVLAENALREGSIAPDQIGFAPYGFIGWKLHGHFVRHEGATDADIGGFMRYQRPDAPEVRRSPLRFWQDSKSLRPLPPPDDTRVIQSDVFRVGWIWHQRVTLLTSPSAGPARLPFDRSRYQPRFFPLNDKQWWYPGQATRRNPDTP